MRHAAHTRTHGVLTNAVISIYNFKNLVTVLFVGHIAWTYAAKYGGLPQILPRTMAGLPESNYFIFCRFEIEHFDPSNRPFVVQNYSK